MGGGQRDAGAGGASAARRLTAGVGARTSVASGVDGASALRRVEPLHRQDLADAFDDGVQAGGLLDGLGEGLDLNGFTLTKEGLADFGVVDADMTNGTVNVVRGQFVIEGNAPIRSGTTINPRTSFAISPM